MQRLTRPLASPALVASRRAMGGVRHMGAKTISPLLNRSIKESDPEIFDIMEREKRRQIDNIAMIPSENFTSQAVLEALGSVMQNKYSEGYPGARYYGGNEFIDMSENACRNRALELYKLDPKEWGVNVQTLSGSPANFAVYTAVLGPHGKMMALDLPHGGHLSHGYETPTKKISATSIYFECFPYRLDESKGTIDYDTLEKNARIYRPKMLVTGASAYSRHIDYARMKTIANEHKSFFMVDMAHISGLVAAGVMPSPFQFADIVTTTTHKSLRGPRGAMVFFRKGVRSKNEKGEVEMYDLESRINQAVFPGHQGGPHNHTITALAVALKQANTPLFRQYQQNVLDNCQALASGLMSKNINLVSGGTDNHLLLADLRPQGINGAKVERVLELVNISMNKNTVPGDVSAMNPGGIRLGTPAMTTRGMDQADFKKVAHLIVRGIDVAKAAEKIAGSKKMADFRTVVDTQKVPGLLELKAEVTALARTFPPVGFNLEDMKYRE